ncbi:MAG: hypothetical protein EB127_26410 [Alphaproteobacteria bacterium]|nr:hypothetical protein [Alphaproteobacteria bacterium]
MIQVGKLYKTAFSELKVDFKKDNPNKWEPWQRPRSYSKTISPEDIFMVLEFEPLDQKLLSGKPPPQDEYPFVIKILCKETIGYVLLRDCEIKEIC